MTAQRDAELQVKRVPEDRILRRPAGSIGASDARSSTAGRPSSAVAVAQARARARMAMSSTRTASGLALERRRLGRQTPGKVRLKPDLSKSLLRLRHVGAPVTGRKLAPRAVAGLLRQLLDPRCASVKAITKVLRDGGYEVVK